MSSFGRRTWDRDEYAELAQESRSHKPSLLDTLTPQQLAQLKLKYTDHHELIESSSRDPNKRMLTAAISSYKKGKQFGFYCDLCDLTFKDTLQYIDHLNHKSHQIKFEQLFEEPLIYDTRDNDEVSLEEFEQVYSDLIDGFVKTNTTLDIEEKLRLKETRKKRIQDAKIRSENKKEKLTQPADDSISGIMGFASFGSTRR